MIDLIRFRHGQSLCLIEVFYFFGPEKQIRLQKLNKRYYNQHVYGLVKSICLFRPRGISLMDNSPNMRLLEVSAGGYAWKDFPVREQGESDQTRQAWFNGKSQVGLTSSVIVQVGKTKVYLIGGLHPSLLSREYNVKHSCLRVDLETAVLEQL